MATELPTLPQEAWDLILLNHKTDHTVPELWLSHRHVSTKFRDTIESLFRDSILPKTFICVQLGMVTTKH